MPVQPKTPRFDGGAAPGFCSAITSTIQNSGGRVEVTETVIETSYGPLGLMILKPETATLENPAPCVVACHGSYNSKEMQSPAMVELSRRGVVVVSLDMFCHGHSANAESLVYIDDHKGGYYNVETGEFVSDKAQATAVNAHGIIEAVEYVYSSLGYIDRERIGVTGHSMGGVSSTNAVRYYHNVSTLLEEPQKITSAFFQSCTLAACCQCLHTIFPFSKMGCPTAPSSSTQS